MMTRKIRTLNIVGLALGAMVMVAGGCNSTKKAGNDGELLREESANLRTQLADRNEALEAANADRRDLAMQNAELRRQLEEANSMAGDLAGRTTGFEGIPDVTSEYGNGEITVSIASDVLFDSGKVDLKNAAKQSLTQVASVLNSQYAGMNVRVAGHTDTDPIKKSGWKTNYHLGSERAYAVMDYLTKQGIAADRMHIASYGPNSPLATKKASRRVEIVVLTN